MIDLHLHLLPGVDDGPAALDAALEMCRMARADGCTTLVATPHQRRDEWATGDPARLEAALAELAAAAAAAGGAPRLLLGGEVRVDSEILADLDAPDRAGIRTLGGSDALLLEFDPRGIGPEPVELVLELAERGLKTLVAHAELTPFFWLDGDGLLERLVDAGAYLQVTAASLCGDFGRPARLRAWELVEGGLAHVVASDAHRPDWRPPGLSRARRELAAKLGQVAAARLTEENPRALLEGRPIAPVSAEELPS